MADSGTLQDVQNKIQDEIQEIDPVNEQMEENYLTRKELEGLQANLTKANEKIAELKRKDKWSGEENKALEKKIESLEEEIQEIKRSTAMDKCHLKREKLMQLSAERDDLREKLEQAQKTQRQQEMKETWMASGATSWDNGLECD